MKNFFAFIFLLASFSASAQQAMDELAVRQAIGIRVAILWEAEDIKELEKMAEEYRSTNAKTPSGASKLSAFHYELAKQLQTSIDDDRIWIKLEQRSFAWASAFPNSPTAQLQHAQTIFNRSWKFKSRAAFNNNVDRAVRYMEEHKGVAAKDPRWYELMLYIANVRGWKPQEQQVLYAEAVAAEPQYLQSHFIAAGFHAPSNGGDADSLELFISSAADRMGGADGDELYTRIYWYAKDNYLGGQLAYAAVKCDRLMRGLDRLLQKNPDLWNVNSLVSHARRCNDKVRAKALMDKIGDTPILSAWGDSTKSFAQTRAWAAK
jgi:hypothetical protein